jgi:hypothetical protein
MGLHGMASAVKVNHGFDTLDIAALPPVQFDEVDGPFGQPFNFANRLMTNPRWVPLWFLRSGDNFAGPLLRILGDEIRNGLDLPFLTICDDEDSPLSSVENGNKCAAMRYYTARPAGWTPQAILGRTFGHIRRPARPKGLITGKLLE